MVSIFVLKPYQIFLVVGSVGNDTLINNIEGPRISIHLDLPIKYKGKIYNVVIVKHKDIKQLLAMDKEIKKVT